MSEEQQSQEQDQNVETYRSKQFLQEEGLNIIATEGVHSPESGRTASAFTLLVWYDINRPRTLSVVGTGNIEKIHAELGRLLEWARSKQGNQGEGEV